MILARTLPAAGATARQGGSPAAQTPDAAGTPFGGVLDKVLDHSDQRPALPPSLPQGPDASLASARQPRDGLLGSPAGSPLRKASPPAFPAQVAALSTATAAYPVQGAADKATPVPAAATPGVVPPVDLAAVFAVLPAAVEAPATKAVADGKSAPARGRGVVQPPALADGAGVPASGVPYAASLSQLFGTLPLPTPQVLVAAANKPTQAGATPSTLVDAGAKILDRAISAEVAAAPHATKAGESGGAFADALAPVIKSVSVETQLAPAVVPSPMQQVIATVRTLGAAPAAAVAVPAPPLLSNRTTTLVLEPANLGTITVRMQLRGGSLDLHLDVGNSQTLGLLTKEKDSLAAAMASQDYQIGTLTMRASDTQTSSQGSDNGSRPHDQPSGGTPSGGGGTAQQGPAWQGGSGYSRQQAGGGRDRSADDKPATPRPPVPAALPDAAGVYI